MVSVKQKIDVQVYENMRVNCEIKTESGLSGKYDDIYRMASGNFSKTKTNINLKPWVLKPVLTQNDLKQLSDIILFARYKCMSTHCRFATNDDCKMAIHLEDHLRVKSTIEELPEKSLEPSWMECAYCEYFCHTNHTDLIEHIKTEHGSSSFQCPYCYYRTPEAFNIKLHLDVYHKDNEKCVFVCKADDFTPADEILNMVEGRSKNVNPLPCGSSKKFIIIINSLSCKYFLFLIICLFLRFRCLPEDLPT